MEGNRRESEENLKRQVRRDDGKVKGGLLNLEIDFFFFQRKICGNIIMSF